ncbi:MAG: leucine-rich repeat protein, partial [Oscillospiraceae bacterium]|nr:leucine-rich repeat protein [Oscillospiraceae bacterium]
MKTFHRVVLYLVSLVLVLLMISAGSGAVLAAEELSPIFETNPLYPQYVPAEAVPILDSAEDTAVQAVSTLDEAVVVLREGLENRTASVRIALPDGHTPAEEDAYYVWNNALEETGVPTQGDYIRWHWSGWGCAWDYEWTGSFYRYFMTFTVSYYTTSAQETELTAEVNKIIDSFGFTSSTSDYDKVKTIHAWVTDNITYDYTSSGSMKQTAYNGIMEGTCVCQGYSSIMYRMLWQVGVPARIIPGDTNATPAPSKDDVDDNHGWNIVKLGEKWYNLDATWDAGIDEENWDYFLTCPDSFTGHYRWPDYDTADFHTAYPMAETDYSPYVASGTCGENLTWTLDSVGVLVISGEGAIDYHCITWWDYLGEITSVVINDGVTSVGNSVFQDCNNLVSISLPNSITYIGSHAFNGCASLASVVIPNGITRIEQDTFAYCEKLISIAIPNTVKYIDNRVFLNCSSLSEIDIPDDVDYIGDWAFFGCSNLETITLPEGINRIGESSFTYCGKLSNITIPESISIIDDWAFGGCCNFTKINIPASVTHISNYAFYQCNSLTSIAFYGDAPSFGCYVFGDVTATAYYPAGNATWTEDVMQDYGGDITWVAYSDEPEIEKFDFAGSTMTLGNELVLNFVYNKALLTGT